jgi:hypothetical protein
VDARSSHGLWRGRQMSFERRPFGVGEVGLACSSHARHLPGRCVRTPFQTVSETTAASGILMSVVRKKRREWSTSLEGCSLLLAPTLSAGGFGLWDILVQTTGEAIEHPGEFLVLLRRPALE